MTFKRESWLLINFCLNQDAFHVGELSITGMRGYEIPNDYFVMRVLEEEVCVEEGEPLLALLKEAGISRDVIGDYGFSRPLKENDLVLFGDMAIYTTCKNNTFNGMPLPSIYVLRENGSLECLKSFSYDDFKCRLGG